jgi:hypothetical protein
MIKSSALRKSSLRSQRGRFRHGTIISLIATASLLFATPASAIGNGKTPTSRFDFMATFVWPGGNDCGGVLVESFWVVTVKHCTEDLPSNAVVRIGSRYRSSGGETRGISQVLENPYADLALVLLDQPSSQRPVRLTSAESFPNNSRAVALGYGGTDGPLQEGLQRIRAHSGSKHSGPLRDLRVATAQWRRAG